VKGKVYISADHGGFQLKEELKAHLAKLGFEVKDFGTYSPEAVDYPDLAFLVAQAVAGNQRAGGGAKGIIIDSIGQASCIVANKVPGVRAVLAHDAFTVNSSREHNDANVLCLGGQLHGTGLARHLVEVWLETPYAGGRHQRRLDKITEIEKRFGGK
jgi:ribose 5-phosphate isomerase B